MSDSSQIIEQISADVGSGDMPKGLQEAAAMPATATVLYSSRSVCCLNRRLESQCEHSLLNECQVSEKIYHAEAMLKVQPGLEAAMCCCVEGLTILQTHTWSGACDASQLLPTFSC